KARRPIFPYPTTADVGYRLSCVARAQRHKLRAQRNSAFYGFIFHVSSSRKLRTPAQALDRVRLRECRPEDLPRLSEIDQQCFPPGIAYDRNELASYIRRAGAL